jgi:superfamily I DNA and/or RNA helicase
MSQLNPKNTTPFVLELCKYYMDFLSSSFKPNEINRAKRFIRLQHEGNKVGVDLSKYEKFNENIKKLFKETKNLSKNIRVAKGDYGVKPNNLSIDLAKKLINKIDEKDIDKITNTIAKILKEYSVSHKNKVDEAYEEVLAITKQDLLKLIIHPITEKMESLIGDQSNYELESIYTMEEGLCDKIIYPLAEKIPTIFNNLLANENKKIKEEISELFNLDDIKSSLINYFQNLDVKDLYLDLKELDNSLRQLEKQELYLYFCEIEIEKRRYPIFYVQMQIAEDVTKSSFDLTLNNELFINTKAIQYAFSVLKKDDKLIENFDEDRKIFISDEENIKTRLNSILNSIISKLRTDGNIDFEEIQKQVSKSINFIISNNCSICVFDKSDESLINDFEDILEMINDGNESEIASLFKSIINDFLLSEPQNIIETIENEWDVKETNEKLTYESPIPLNSEQLKILQALNNKDCKYIVVEGPPGTGKSHTISAIAFNYILKNKSILILSDTKEALDVVENKINDTLNKVRGNQVVQNPILRLGKMGNTYNKIFARASIEEIRTFNRGQRAYLGEIDEKIKQINNYTNDRIKIETEDYKYINRNEINQFLEIKKNFKVEDLSLNVEQLNAVIDNKRFKEIYSLNNFLDDCHLIAEDEIIIDLFNKCYSDKASSLENFKIFLNKLLEFSKYKYLIDDFQKIKVIPNVNLVKFNQLSKIINKYENEYLGILSFMKSKLYQDLDKDFKRISTLKTFELKTNYPKITEIFDVFNRLYEDLKILEKETTENFNIICKIISFSENEKDLEHFYALANKYIYLVEILLSDDENREKINIKKNIIETLLENNIAKLNLEKVNQLKIYFHTLNNFNKLSKNTEKFDYPSISKELQNLHTLRMTNELDKRIIDFYDNNRNTAESLKNIIKKKSKFPKTEFSRLKNAFPCIISSVRDFSNYITLDKDLFDLVVIDEASQVSIAQAFPAILRGKKILVLGDKKQFTNVKSHQAAHQLNNIYKNKLKDVFKKNISRNETTLERLQKFDVKTSVLDFFERLANYDIRLKKHFRGYPQHIEYCSKSFYKSDLQAIRLNVKSIKDTIKFEILNVSEDSEQNINKAEAEFIIKKLEEMKKKETKNTVGIITPFAEQQKYLTKEISKNLNRTYFYDELKLKIMTFDTCQGEERQIVFYSMVAHKKRDKLSHLFPKDLTEVDIEEGGNKYAQRLNVGLSRVQECMYFVLSKSVDNFDGEIGNALRFFYNQVMLDEKLPSKKDLDPKSPMEIKVLEWFKKTNFYMENKTNVEMKAQFKMGSYLKQLEHDYNHPKFVADFLIIFKDKDKTKHAVVEYDGFKDHFEQLDDVNDLNFDQYYTEEHYEREKILESYGFTFIRLNKFNTADDPVKYFDKKLKEVFIKKLNFNTIQDRIEKDVKNFNEANKKFCNRCQKLKPKADFRDKNLSTGYGVHCNQCKNSNVMNDPIIHVAKEKLELKSKIKDAYKIGSEYEITYENVNKHRTSRKIKILSVDGTYIRAFDYSTKENRTFRKDRVLSVR